MDLQKTKAEIHTVKKNRKFSGAHFYDDTLTSRRRQRSEQHRHKRCCSDIPILSFIQHSLSLSDVRISVLVARVPTRAHTPALDRIARRGDSRKVGMGSRTHYIRSHASHSGILCTPAVLAQPGTDRTIFTRTGNCRTCPHRGAAARAFGCTRSDS